MFAYLARPIDQAGESSWLGTFITELNVRMVQAGIGAFKPDEAYLANVSNPVHAERIDSINNTAIYLCDVFIAVLPAGVATLGVPAEIGLALQCNKPTVIFTDIKYSVQLAAWKRKGAQVIDLGHEDELPTADELRKMLTVQPDPDGASMVTLQMSVVDRTKKLDLFSPPPLMVAGQAANLQPGQYSGDAGIDLALSEPVTLFSGQYTLAGTGVHVAIPDGYFGLITGRSSTWARYRCDVRQAVIDSGYRGELMVGIENRSQQEVMFEAGTRLAQIVLLPTWNGGVIEVDDLPAHERGHNGYGSSGH